MKLLFKNKKITLGLASLYIVFASLFTVTGFTTQVLAACDNGSANTSFDFDADNDGCTDTSDLIKVVFRFLSALVGILVVAGITVGGIAYSTSRGNPSGTVRGVKIISNSIIGLVVYFLLVAIANFLVPGGIL